MGGSMSFHNKTYLGDSVYAIREDSGDLTITTENGYPDDPRNRIVLEPTVYAKLVEYASVTYKERQDELERLDEERRCGQ